MSVSSEPASRSTAVRVLLVAGIVLVALNLRPALSAIGPLVGDIRASTGLSNAALGLLTTLPLLAFGVVSALTPLLTRRLGMGRAVGAALVLLTAGLAVRAVPSVALLYAGTAALGVAIAVGNVLLPSLVKRDFPDRAGLMTSLYSGAMGAGAAVASGVSVPLAEALGWRWALGLWAIPAAVALLVWLPQLRHRRRARSRRTIGEAFRHLGRAPLAWHVALFMGLQSLTFYVLLAWLPEILQSRGASADEAGWLLALLQGVGIGGTLLVPLWAARRRDQRRIVWTLGALEAATLLGLLIPSMTFVPYLVSVLGFLLGGAFGLALLFFVLRTDTPETATALSGVAQSVGYFVAAAGPTLFGWLHDLSGAWSLPLLSLLGVVALKVAFGTGAGRDETISEA